MKPEIKEIQPEDKWFNYLEAGTKPNEITTTKLLKSINEGNECLHSGKVESNLSMATGEKVSELADYPVDSNTQNILPSNMVTVDKSVLTTTPMAFKMSVNLKSVKLQLFVDSLVYKHNQKMIEQVATDAIPEEMEDPKELFGLWDFFTKNHIKGLGELTFNKTNGISYSIGTMEAMMFFSTKIKKGMEATQNKDQRPNLSLA